MPSEKFKTTVYFGSSFFDHRGVCWDDFCFYRRVNLPDYLSESSQKRIPKDKNKVSHFLSLTLKTCPGPVFTGTAHLSFGKSLVTQGRFDSRHPTIYFSPIKRNVESEKESPLLSGTMEIFLIPDSDNATQLSGVDTILHDEVEFTHENQWTSLVKNDNMDPGDIIAAIILSLIIIYFFVYLKYWG
jgi:hypothetical protein